MTTAAQCNCGQLRAICHGDPERVSLCHCINCKRRTGSAFSWNAGYANANIETTGKYQSFSRKTDTGRVNTYHFCPACGSTVFYITALRPSMTFIPAGAFGDTTFHQPSVEVFENRRVDWCQLAV